MRNTKCKVNQESTAGSDPFDSGVGILLARVETNNRSSLPGSPFWLRVRMSMCRMAIKSCSNRCCSRGENLIAHRVAESTRTLIAALAVVAPVRADDVLVVILVLIAGGAGVRAAGVFHCGVCGEARVAEEKRNIATCIKGIIVGN